MHQTVVPVWLLELDSGQMFHDRAIYIHIHITVEFARDTDSATIVVDAGIYLNIQVGVP